MTRSVLIPVERLLAAPAKILASAVFVSGRDPEEAEQNSALFFLPGPIRELLTVAIDREARQVRLGVELGAERVAALVARFRQALPLSDAAWEAEAARLRSLGAVTRVAQHTGDQGCVLLPPDGRLRFTPVPVVSSLPDPATQDWPMGDRLPEGPPRLDPAALAGALEAAFASREACTAAFLVVHRGRVVAERYAPGIDRDTQLESWSMGKSITATLVGLLIRDAHLTLEQPAPIPAWQAPDDPRRAIRVAHLMRMSSGLRFSGDDDPPERWEHGVPDHVLPYTEARDVFALATGVPAEHPPDTVGRYRNCDTLALGAIVKRIVTEKLGEEYLTWPQRALFDRIGIRRQVLETDAWGNFILSGFDYGTARNWARLGLLWLQDGVWLGERLLPEGLARFVRTPAPAWERPEYGAQFWVNGTGEYPLPRDAFSMAGSGEQRVFIVPSHDLVVVRLGHRRGEAAGALDLKNALERLVAAVEAAA
jgi:CubicO group peptidase (beta-lactamase class C family)